VAAACAASIGVLALPAEAAQAAPTTRRAKTGPPARAVKRAVPATSKKGRDLFTAIFFDTGSYAGNLDEFHAGNAEALRVNRKARVKRDPARMRTLARYFDARKDAQSAKAARSAAAVWSKAEAGTMSGAKARELLLDGIEAQDPTFFRRFAAAVTSGNPAKVDAALVESGHVTLAAVEQLQGENALGNVTMGPQAAVEIVVVIVIVIVIAVAITEVAIDKDSPDQVKAPGDGCSGGGDCDEMQVPKSVLQRTELAKLIATRFSAV
jgi:hypothetical protein